MPRTKANVIAAAERKKAQYASKISKPVGAAKRKSTVPVRSRQWRLKWFRQVRKAQGNKAAALNYLNRTGMRRLIKEIQMDQRPDLVMRWQGDAIDAIRGAYLFVTSKMEYLIAPVDTNLRGCRGRAEEAQERMTNLFQVANAITVACGNQTIKPKQFRLAAKFLGMELPPKEKRTLVLQRPDQSERAPSSDAQTGRTESAS